MSDLATRLPELIELEAIIKSLGSRAITERLATVSTSGIDFPIYGMVFGNQDPEAPTVGFFGGVHGLERIGTRVLIAYLHTIESLLRWDEGFAQQLEKIRIVFMPLVNPSGMYLRRRSNFNGVDLMRNAPIEADIKSRWVLVGGHRISNRLPWYRGAEGAEMEPEAQALCQFVRKWILPSKFALSLDVHSGFGTVDRLWFPYARSKGPFPHLSEAHSFKKLLDETYPNHIYCVEPQSAQYTTHGDLWDFMYEESVKTPDRTYIPWALELGSWLWVKKNPKQLFTVVGAFNPLIQHRYQRILRRHLLLLDFFQRSVRGWPQWGSLSPESSSTHRRAGLDLWFEDNKAHPLIAATNGLTYSPK